MGERRKEERLVNERIQKRSIGEFEYTRTSTAIILIGYDAHVIYMRSDFANRRPRIH